MHLMAVNGIPEAINALVSLGAAVNGRIKNGDAPLHLAVEHGRFSNAIELLRKDANVNAQNKKGDTPLHLAVRGGIQFVKLLLGEKAKVNVNAQNNIGDTPLHMATKNGNNHRVVKLLAENDADVNLRNADGDTPLHQAVRNKSFTSVKILVEWGAHIHQGNNSQDTPMDEARKIAKPQYQVKMIAILSGQSVPSEKNRENTEIGVPQALPNPDLEKEREMPPTYERLMRPEQRQFRENLIRAYEGSCAITGESTDAVLDASHLPERDYKQGHNRARDGILLRTDLHRLLDAGLMSFTAKGIIQISREAGVEYQKLHGQTIRFPKRKADRPQL